MKAFKTFSQCPEDLRPHPDVPMDWPWSISDCDELNQTEFEGQGYTVLSDIAFDSYLAQRQQAYDAWLLVYKQFLESNPPYLANSVTKTKLWAESLMDRIKVMNIQGGGGVANGLWLHHRLRSITITVQQSHVDSFSPLAPLLGVTFTVDLINMITTGDAESVYGIFCCLTPDDMTQPYHGLSQTFINYVKSEIAVYLGWS